MGFALDQEHGLTVEIADYRFSTVFVHREICTI